MAEQVTTFGGGPFPDRDRLKAATEHFGGARGEIRDQNGRDAQAMFDWLKAAKARYPISRVVRHVCHHDQGIGNCTDSVVEG